MELQHSSETQHVDKGHQTTVDTEVTELEYNFDKDIILNSGLKLIAIQLEYQSGGSGHIESTVEDKGEGPGSPDPPFIFRPNWRPKGWTLFFLETAPLSSQGLDDCPPPLIWRSGSGTQVYGLLLELGKRGVRGHFNLSPMWNSITTIGAQIKWPTSQEKLSPVHCNHYIYTCK